MVGIHVCSSSFSWSTWHSMKRGTSIKELSQSDWCLRHCLDWSSARAPLNCTIPGLVDLGCVRKVTEYQPVSKLLSTFFHGPCFSPALSSYRDFLHWSFVTCQCKLSLALSSLSWFWTRVFYHNIREQLRTTSFKKKYKNLCFPSRIRVIRNSPSNWLLATNFSTWLKFKLELWSSLLLELNGLILMMFIY